MAVATENKCPHPDCGSKWYKKTTETRIDGAGNNYYVCNCLKCEKMFDMRQELYNHFDTRMKRFGSSDKDIAELLMNNWQCLYCENQLAEEVSEEIKNDQIVSKILHCRNCEKSFYIPKSWFEEIHSK